MPAVLYEKRGKTAYVTINRPEKLNAINYEVRAGLLESWEKVNKDPDVWSVIITGAGEKAFSAGADMEKTAEFRENEPTADLPLNTESTFGADVMKPIIGAINGYCVGAGFLLSFYCDIRVASENAKFGLPECKRGIVSGHGLNIKVANYFPTGIAAEMLLLGELFDAQKAYHFGYVNKVVPQTDLMSAAETVAWKINNLSPLVMKNIKSCYKVGAGISPQSIEFNDTMARMIRYSEDYKEGINAFAQKRTPVWKGK
jgi:enoyl-CoA hydratase/carnithine racemase